MLLLSVAVAWSCWCLIFAGDGCAGRGPVGALLPARWPHRCKSWGLCKQLGHGRNTARRL